MALKDELQEIIASVVRDKGVTEVVRFSSPYIDTFYLSSFVKDGQQIKDENGDIQTVRYAPMKLGDESSGQLLLSERNVSFQGVNDLIAREEDKIPTDTDERLNVDVLTYIHDYDGVLSDVAEGPYRYFNQKTTYSSQNNAVNFTISTTPTNNSRTGDSFTKENYPTLKGFEV